jgi:cytochrome c oxidase accessory protein FixG
MDIAEELYRDSISTVDKDGKRVWVYPKKPKGRLHNYRLALTLGYLALFFAGPFVKINGHPLLLINPFERHFVLFGQVFTPHDFALFGLGMIIFFVFIILFTVVYGRIWCGWLCPQTVFMEMVFRKIEYWIEGDRNQQRALDAAPWNAEKLAKKGIKQLIFVLFSALIAHATMAYIIGIEQTIDVVRQHPRQNASAFGGIVVFTGIFYFVFARMREQICTSICPYGRLQGVLVDKNTLAVMYDYKRGEPRHKIQKAAAVPTVGGDCVDCTLCVQVCPTGIDIRNGTQLECINCTACIDACDDVMTKVHRPLGLIRLASEASVAEGKPFVFGRRTWVFTAILVVLVGIEAALLVGRNELETTVLRVPGQLFQELPNGRISNLYNAQFVNKTFEDITLSLRVNTPGSRLNLVGGSITVAKAGRAEAVFFVEVDKNQLRQRKQSIVIEVVKNGQVIDEQTTSFFSNVE